MVEQAMHMGQKSLPSIKSAQPEITVQGNPDGKGYEWIEKGDDKWYRPVETSSWIKWEN